MIIKANDDLLKNNRNILSSPLLSLVIGSLISIILLWSFIPHLHFHIPNQESALFLFGHYVLALFMLIPLGFFLSSTKKIIIKTAFCTISFLLILLVHFNLKNWAGLANDISYDELYQNIDHHFNFILSSFSFIRIALPFHELSMLGAYHWLFVVEFFLIYTWGIIRNWDIEGITFGLCFILVFGGFLYWAAPAFGPFIFRPDMDVFASQKFMLNYYSHYLASSGTSYESQYFAAPLAAMPSLHIAHGTFFLLFSLKKSQMLTIFSGTLLFYFIVEASALGWHFLIDFPIGISLTLIAIHATKKAGYNV